MIDQIGKTLPIRAYYTTGKLGRTGLTVTVTVIAPDNTVLVLDAATVEIGWGLYGYWLDAVHVTMAGQYVALFYTGDTTVNMQSMVTEWTVGTAWVQYIDAAISSCLASASYLAPNNSGIGSILSTLGIAGAGLTNIPSIPGMATATGVLTVLTAVNALTNQGARSGPVVPSVFVRPSSGSVAYVGYIRVWTNGGSAEDPDSNSLIIHAADRIGGNLDGHLASTGRTLLI
jgi:hypothetical protein